MIRLVCASAVLFLFTLTPVYAQVQKWTDENGVTHYGDKPPAGRTSESVDIETRSDRAGQRQQPGDPRKMAEQKAQGFMKGEPNAKNLNCSSAVKSGRDGIDTMLSAGRSNVKHGSLDQSEYEHGARELGRIRKRISVSECKSSRGKVRQFYLCLSNSRNQVAYCGRKYGYK